MKKLGLVGGLGVGAGVFYYERLAAAFLERGAEPGLMLTHAEIGRAYSLVQEGRRAELAVYLNAHLQALQAAGCELAAIAAVTPLICQDELAPIAALPLVDVFACVNAELRRRGARRVGVMGTRFVMKSGMFGRLEGVEIVRPSPEDEALVANNYLIIARTGNPAYADIEAVRAVGARMAAAGAEAVILAGTELSLAFEEANAGFPALDSGRAHVATIVEAALT